MKTTFKTKEEFIKKAKNIHLNISDWANEMLEKVQVIASKKFEPTIRTVESLGFTGYTRYDEILKKADILGLDPMTHAEALSFALERKPEMNQWLFLVTEPIEGPDRFPSVFKLGRYVDVLWLYDSWALPDGEWHPRRMFVFRLRKTLKNSDTLAPLGNLDSSDSLTLASLEKRIENLENWARKLQAYPGMEE